MADNPSLTPPKEVRGKEKSSKEDLSTDEVRKSAGKPASQKGGKKPPTVQAPMNSANEGSSGVTLNAAALGSVIAEALKGSFEGLRDSMNAGFNDLNSLIASRSGGNGDEDSADDCDSSVSKDDVESLVEEEPPAKKKRLNEQGKNSNPLITKLTKTLQLTEHVGPAIDGELASLVDKIMREKGNEDKIMELKKQHETPENCATLSETKVNQGVWNNLDESARSTDLKFQKVQKSLIKGIIVVVSEVNKLMGDSETQKEDTVSALMDGVLLLANANQELNYRRRELMRPQLNTNFRHLCSPSNPVTAELFGDDLPKAVKDISDTNRLSSKLTKDGSSHHSKKTPPLQKEAGGEEEERLSSNPIQVSLTTNEFAGRLRHFLSTWMSITADQDILDMVQHCHLEIANPTQLRLRPEIQFDSKEEGIITSEIAHLLELGVIEPAVHTPDEYISTIFVRKKKSGQYRMILNLKGLNKHIEKHHFKMDTLWSAVRLMTPNCFMASIDLKEAYYLVPIAKEHRKYLRFYWKGFLYQYTCMPNGLSSAPRCFTKLMKPVYSTLRQKGHLNVGYIDDSYLQGRDANECLLNISDTQRLLSSLGKYRDVFAFSDAELGRTSLVQHVIDTSDATPIKQMPYRTSPEGKQEIGRQVKDMLERGIFKSQLVLGLRLFF
ncbi:Polyprotein P3 [Stylophora pistillata]|uniref:Polyprotein P3 n=1 Tax=Stylophora pistillata TaxID=50429 RepID=A0A2B4R9P0_STYPI|nr:Polyprotein P3 [Stylophora pistillata]